MMPTNDERREVAARLRAVDDEEWYDVRDELKAIDEAIGVAYGMPYSFQTSWNRLADLIEPEPERTCRNTTRQRSYGFECSECRWSAYEPNDYGNDVRFDDFNYCPNCGAKVVE